MKNCAGCNEGLVTVASEDGVRFIALWSRSFRTQGPVWGQKVGSRHLKCRLDPAARVLPGEINAMENCACCNEGLAIVPGEVGVQFIALLRRFDRTQGPVCGGIVGSRHLKCRLDPAAWVLPG